MEFSFKGAMETALRAQGNPLVKVTIAEDGKTATIQIADKYTSVSAIAANPGTYPHGRRGFLRRGRTVFTSYGRAESAVTMKTNCTSRPDCPGAFCCRLREKHASGKSEKEELDRAAEEFLRSYSKK